MSGNKGQVLVQSPPGAHVEYQWNGTSVPTPLVPHLNGRQSQQQVVVATIKRNELEEKEYSANAKRIERKQTKESTEDCSCINVQRVKQLHHDVEHLQQVHERTLNGLHQQVEQLKIKNRDLTFQLLMSPYSGNVQEHLPFSPESDDNSLKTDATVSSVSTLPKSLSSHSSEAFDQFEQEQPSAKSTLQNRIQTTAPQRKLDNKSNFDFKTTNSATSVTNSVSVDHSKPWTQNSTNGTKDLTTASEKSTNIQPFPSGSEIYPSGRQEEENYLKGRSTPPPPFEEGSSAMILWRARKGRAGHGDPRQVKSLDLELLEQEAIMTASKLEQEKMKTERLTEMVDDLKRQLNSNIQKSTMKEVGANDKTRDSDKKFKASQRRKLSDASALPPVTDKKHHKERSVEDEWPEVLTFSLNSTHVLPSIPGKANKTEVGAALNPIISSKSSGSGEKQAAIYDNKSVKQFSESPRHSAGSSPDIWQRPNSSGRESSQARSTLATETNQFSPKKIVHRKPIDRPKTSNASSEDLPKEGPSRSKIGFNARLQSGSKTQLQKQDSPRKSPSNQRTEELYRNRNGTSRESPVRSLSRSSNRSNSGGSRYTNDTQALNTKRNSDSSPTVRFVAPSSPHRFINPRTTNRSSKFKTEFSEAASAKREDITETNTSAVESTDFEAEPARLPKSKSPKSSRKYLSNPGSSPRSARRLPSPSLELTEPDKGDSTNEPGSSSTKGNIQAPASGGSRPNGGGGGGKSRGRNRNRGNKKNGKGKQKKEEISN